MRMSSGPDWRNEKPRSARSSCGEDTPRSNRAPLRPSVERGVDVASASSSSGGRGIWSVGMIWWRSSNRAWTARKRPPKRSRRAVAAARAAGIAVDAEDQQVVAAVEQRLGVAAPAERGVEDHPGRHRGEDLDDLVEHHRPVHEGVGHPGPAVAGSSWSSRLLPWHRVGGERWGARGHSRPPAISPRPAAAICS